LKGSFERPAAERPARSVAPLEIGEPPRKILRPLDAARRFTPASFAFLQSRHHIMYRHRDVWSVPDLNNGESEDAPIEIAPRPRAETSRPA
jgi:hypothetical protein